MAGRTLTQHAVPITFGLKAAGWLDGILDAAVDLTTAGTALPVQAGGAAGTAAALAELAGSPVAVETAGAALASRLGLAVSAPWHTRRRPVTRVGDALVGLVDALGHVANDVVLLARPEVGELSEGTGGGSSTMPQKQNPVLATLLRRAALTAPLLGAQLHAAAAAAVDERPAGAWHAEWAPLRALTRITLVAADQAADLLGAWWCTRTPWAPAPGTPGPICWPSGTPSVRCAPTRLTAAQTVRTPRPTRSWPAISAPLICSSARPWSGPPGTGRASGDSEAGLGGLRSTADGAAGGGARGRARRSARPFARCGANARPP